MKLIMRKASIRWKGGARIVTTESGALNSLKNHSDTDPAELIAAAHASSFSTALLKELHLRASAADETSIMVTMTLEYLAGGWTIVKIHLDVVAKLPNVTQGRFIDATVRAKTNCLVSRLVRSNISMNAKLEK